MHGFIASFKGIREVAGIFKDIDPAKAMLIIAGQPRANEPEYVRSLREECLHPAVALFDRAIPEEDVNLFVCSADWAVYNQSYALNSSGMQLAHDYGCPIIGPDLEATRHVSVQKAEGFQVVTFRSFPELEALIKERMG